MSHSVVVLSGGDLGNEKLMVRCDLANASSTVQVDWCNGRGRRPSGWEGTQWQCADTGHHWDGLATLALVIAADGSQIPRDEFDCEVHHPTDLDFRVRAELGLVSAAIVAIADVLAPYGDRMTGWTIEATAHEWSDHGFCYQEIYDAVDHGLTCADTLRRVLDLTGQTLEGFLMSAEGGAK